MKYVTKGNWGHEVHTNPSGRIPLLSMFEKQFWDFTFQCGSPKGMVCCQNQKNVVLDPFESICNFFLSFNFGILTLFMN